MGEAGLLGADRTGGTADQHIERAEQRRGVKTAAGESKWHGVRVQKVLRRATHAERLLQCDAVR